MEPLITNRLMMRDFEEDDWNDAHEFLVDQEVCRYMVFEPLDEEKARAYIKRFLEFQKEEERSCYKFAVLLRETKKVIGECGIISPDMKKRVGEIVYRFNREHWGLGYATEAVNEVIKFGFDELGLHRIEAYCDDRNKDSMKVLEKAGFRYEGCLREHKFIKGNWRSSCVYSKLKLE